jgi:hypothetical protein
LSVNHGAATIVPYKASDFFQPMFLSTDAMVSLNTQNFAPDMQDAALTLKRLVQVIDDPQAKARTRLDAMQTLKEHLIWLQRLIEAPETAPDLRKEMIEALRTYRRS